MKLYCLGDSLTFGFGMSRNVRWTTLVEQEAGWQVVNRGINGDTTGGMLARLGPEVLDQIGSDRTSRLDSRILIMGGSNDVFFGGTDSAARANMAAMCQRLMGEGLEPYVGISLPVDWTHAPRQWAQVVDFEQAARIMRDYCNWLKQFCGVFGLPVVDFAADFVLPDGSADHALFWDGLHPNAQGHRLMADRMIRALQPVTDKT
ncbi:MAG: GDSL family lipase [Oscillospiraceae bacterium]|nr:GDSL family lipase [Oscillospiraceae bacterium]